jgi:hypothetical protein
MPPDVPYPDGCFSDPLRPIFEGLHIFRVAEKPAVRTVMETGLFNIFISPFNLRDCRMVKPYHIEFSVIKNVMI